MISRSRVSRMLMIQVDFRIIVTQLREIRDYILIIRTHTKYDLRPFERIPEAHRQNSLFAPQ